MKKLGFFTGHIYDKSEPCEECAVNLSDERAKDIAYTSQEYLRRHVHCFQCDGCPEAKKARHKK